MESPKTSYFSYVEFKYRNIIWYAILNQKRKIENVLKKTQKVCYGFGFDAFLTKRKRLNKKITHFIKKKIILPVEMSNFQPYQRE